MSCMFLFSFQASSAQNCKKWIMLSTNHSMYSMCLWQPEIRKLQIKPLAKSPCSTLEAFTFLLQILDATNRWDKMFTWLRDWQDLVDNWHVSFRLSEGNISWRIPWGTKHPHKCYEAKKKEDRGLILSKIPEYSNSWYTLEFEIKQSFVIWKRK